MRLSFIIPAYNVSQFIPRCLESILALPVEAGDIEIVVVDDCSTDNTREVVGRMAQQHSNIILLCQSENHRQGAARNKGIEAASGDFVVFVDADDVVEDGVVAALNRAEREKLDICFYGILHEGIDGSYREVKWSMPSNTVVDGVTFLNEFLDMDINSVWRGVYRRNLIIENHLSFVENVRWEDGDFCLNLYCCAKSIGNVNENGYIYKRNEQSTNFTQSYQTQIDRIRLGLRLIGFVDSNREKLNKGAEIVLDDVRYRYVHGVVRLRNLTKYSWKENVRICNSLPNSEWIKLKPYAISNWERLYLSHPGLASAFLFFACPVAKAVRIVVSLFRNVG